MHNPVELWIDENPTLFLSALVALAFGGTYFLIRILPMLLSKLGDRLNNNQFMAIWGGILIFLGLCLWGTIIQYDWPECEPSGWSEFLILLGGVCTMYVGGRLCRPLLKDAGTK